jgi:hypothetical protein
MICFWKVINSVMSVFVTIPPADQCGAQEDSFR